MSESTSPVTASQEVSEEKEITIYFSDIFKGLFKFWWVCALLAVLFGGFMFYRYKICFSPQYTASATFTVAIGNSDEITGASSYAFYYSSATADQLADTFPALLSTKLMKDAINNELKDGGMAASLSMSSVAGTNMFTLKAVGRDPQLTYDSLMAAVRCYPSVAKYVVGDIEIRLITEPEIPSSPSNTSEYLQKTLIGMAVGVVLGLCWILAYAIFRKTIRSEEDVKEVLKSEVLGILPVVTFKKYKEETDHSVLITNPLVQSRYSEEIKVTRNTILQKAEGKKVLMVTSTAPGEGKTTIATNLALSIAQADRKVLIIDGDMRNPSVFYQLYKEEAPQTKGKLWSIGRYEKGGIDVLTFNVQAKEVFNMMQAERLSEIVEPLKEQYDTIIIDTPPCGLISDALTFAQVSDGAIFVILHDTIRSTRIKNTLDMLNYTDVELVGCIINGLSHGVVSGYGYNKYTYGKYGYGYGRYGYYGYGKYGYGKYGNSYGYGYGYGYGEHKSSSHRHSKKK